MPITRRQFAPVAVAGLLAGCGGPTTTTAPVAGVGLADITYAGLDAAVKEQKGKVVLIDVWFLA